jgi:hypothetical protein
MNSVEMRMREKMNIIKENTHTHTHKGTGAESVRVKIQTQHCVDPIASVCTMIIPSQRSQLSVWVLVYSI